MVAMRHGQCIYVMLWSMWNTIHAQNNENTFTQGRNATYTTIYVICIFILTNEAMGVTSVHVAHQYIRSQPLNLIFI